ncbi:MAG: hypothetical protein R3313_03065 [Candidatus Saccharimonadales bacterium]|nr:hypothetical protein [Candidatus Saccharimonadales bacterium]
MNPEDKKYWFKRKRYGWGWVPTTWQGWALTVAYIVIVIAGAYWFLKDVPEDTWSDEVGYYLVFVAVTVILFIRITAAKSPSGKWRFGKKDTDDKDKDW